MPGPLEGYRVLDLTSVLLGPYATMILGDLGADVVKIEGHEGDTTRHTGPRRHRFMASFFLSTNRNKRSIVLDLKQETAKEALWRLIDGADVLVHSIRPESMDRLGFGPDAVLARNPRIVYAGIHGFGVAGPYANRPAYDDIIQAGSGLSALMKRITGEALYTPFVAADKTCGLTTAYAVMAGLLHRERTGQGQFVEIPMFETMVSFNLMEHGFGHVFYTPEGPMGYSRGRARLRGPNPD
jgi:crotonobetainyl-CoA:carnitine CoA-transferase CaiB-like acyl-CoA transferase